MRAFGGLIIFLAVYGFSQSVTTTGLLWLFFGIVLLLLPEILEVIVKKVSR